MTHHISTKQHTLALSQHAGMFFIVTPIILSYSQQVVWAPDMVFKCNVLLTKRPRLRFFLQTEWMRGTVCHSASVSLMLSLNTWGIMFLWPPLLNASFLLLSLRSCWQSGPNFIPPVLSRRAWVSWLESDKPSFSHLPTSFSPLCLSSFLFAHLTYYWHELKAHLFLSVQVCQNGLLCLRVWREMRSCLLSGAAR